MSRYRDQVAAALGAVTIRGDARYTWLGRLSRPLSARLEAAMEPSERRSYLLHCLRGELYSSFYRHGRPVPARWGEPKAVSCDPLLVSSMSDANSGRGGWEPGWTVERLDGDDAVVATHRLRARVAAHDCRPLAGVLAPGAPVSIRVPGELLALSPGFYTALGEVMTEHAPARSAVRVYWNVGRDGAPALVRALTSRLNGAATPFRLKVADHPSRLTSCDAAVLYLSGDAFLALRETLARVAAELRFGLRPEIPAFTLRLAPGVGLAENNSAGESFGASRCALLAEGILRAHERGAVAARAQIDAVAARFAEAGVEIDAPYLEPSLAGRHVL